MKTTEIYEDFQCPDEAIGIALKVLRTYWVGMSGWPNDTFKDDIIALERIIWWLEADAAGGNNGFGQGLQPGELEEGMKQMGWVRKEYVRHE